MHAFDIQTAPNPHVFNVRYVRLHVFSAALLVHELPAHDLDYQLLTANSLNYKHQTLSIRDQRAYKLQILIITETEESRQKNKKRLNRAYGTTTSCR